MKQPYQFVRLSQKNTFQNTHSSSSRRPLPFSQSLDLIHSLRLSHHSNLSISTLTLNAKTMASKENQTITITFGGGSAAKKSNVRSSSSNAFPRFVFSSPSLKIPFLGFFGRLKNSFFVVALSSFYTQLARVSDSAYGDQKGISMKSFRVLSLSALFDV